MAATLDDYDFSSADAGADTVFNCEAGQIRVGGYMVIKDRPAKVSAVSTSKTGKHGHAKCNFTAIDIFNGKKYEDIIPSTHNAHVPFVKRGEYTLVDITDEGFLSLMAEDGTCRDDIKLPPYPEGFDREIENDFNAGKNLVLTLMSAMKIDQIVAKKEETVN